MEVVEITQLKVMLLTTMKNNILPQASPTSSSSSSAWFALELDGQLSIRRWAQLKLSYYHIIVDCISLPNVVFIHKL